MLRRLGVYVIFALLLSQDLWRYCSTTCMYVSLFRHDEGSMCRAINIAESYYFKSVTRCKVTFDFIILPYFFVPGEPQQTSSMDTPPRNNKTSKDFRRSFVCMYARWSLGGGAWCEQQVSG